MNKLPIFYSAYWDAPLSFVVGYLGETYSFIRGDFDEELDEYPSNYIVKKIKGISLKM